MVPTNLFQYDTKIRYFSLKKIIRFILQGTVYNTLGPDCSADRKALDSNYCRQPTNQLLHDLCLTV